MANADKKDEVSRRDLIAAIMMGGRRAAESPSWQKAEGNRQELCRESIKDADCLIKMLDDKEAKAA